ncbi:MAG TPA: alpha/beta hydrolase [Usitatibacter sp.]|nr:alpha/beta hydrolase [Usitatibacter sp.]
MSGAFTPEFVEREYNNRALVPEHPAFFARWEKDSGFVREVLQPHLDLPYGPHARQRIDVFPATHARGTLMFIHGGYWRSLDKSMFSWLAASWVAAGVSVAMPNYRLAPEVGIARIVDDIIDATNWLALNGAKYGAPPPFVVSGHSAGGHLTAALFATPWSRLELDPASIAGGVPFSGVFDFEPLLIHGFNADFKLDAEAARALTLLGRKPTVAAPLVVAAGASESSEFQRQSRELAAAWAPQARELMLPGHNHFSIVDSFAERGQPLYEETLRLFA